MHMGGSIVLEVLHRSPGSASLHAGEGHGLELVQDPGDLRRRGLVVRVPGDHARGVPLLERQGVDQFPQELRIAAQHSDPGTLVALVVDVAE